MSSHVADFTTRNKILIAKLSNKVIGITNFVKLFSKFDRRHYDLVSKFNTGLKCLLKQGLSELEFHGDLVYKFRKNVGRNDFLLACLVVNPITVKPLSDCHKFGYEYELAANVVGKSKRCRPMSAVLVLCRHILYIVGGSLRDF